MKFLILNAVGEWLGVVEAANEWSAIPVAQKLGMKDAAYAKEKNDR